MCLLVIQKVARQQSVKQESKESARQESQEIDR
jgi:hypothetical protein